jgi:hypothetical protein
VNPDRRLVEQINPIDPHQLRACWPSAMSIKLSPKQVDGAPNDKEKVCFDFGTGEEITFQALPDRERSPVPAEVLRLHSFLKVGCFLVDF